MENLTIRKIEGNDVNDIMLVSNWGKVSHFNGASWINDDTILDNWGSSNAITLQRHISYFRIFPKFFIPM